MGLFDFLKPKPTQDTDLDRLMAMVALQTFPGGLEQIEREAGQLYSHMNGKLSRDEAKFLLTKTKALLAISPNQSEERITSSIHITTNGKLSPADAHAAYAFISGDNEEIYGGGDGSSEGEAVIIRTTDSTNGIRAEYRWIEKRYGKRDKDWTVAMRHHGPVPNGRYIEVFNIAVSATGHERSIYFEISAFFGK